MKALFMKFYRFMLPTLVYTLKRHAAQAIPLENLASRTGEGHSFQILTVATPQTLFKTISNSGHSMRHGQTWLISHQEFENTPTPCVKTGANQLINTLHEIIDPNIFCMFRAGNSRFCTTFAEKSNIFLRISRIGKPTEMPQIVEPRFSGPCL